MFRKQLKGTEINRGNHGKIYRLEESITHRKFVYKKLKERNSCIYIEENINDFIGTLQNERIIKYFGGFEIKQSKFIFMEYLKGGSLQNRIGKHNITIIKITKQILEALEFLHGKKIIHRDIKPDKVLLDIENIKLTDFGCSLPLFKVGKNNLQNGEFCGTNIYIAPEITSEETYSCSVDIWSLGITVIEMATGKRLHQPVNHDMFINGANSRTIEYQLPDSSQSHNLKLFINKMLTLDGTSRPSAAELLSNLNIYFPNYLFE